MNFMDLKDSHIWIYYKIDQNDDTKFEKEEN